MFPKWGTWCFRNWLYEPFRENAAKCAAYMVAFIEQLTGKPYRWERPNAEWREDLSDVTPFPSSNNSRRLWAARSFHYLREDGFWDHMSVLFQRTTKHWDCPDIR